MKIRRKEIVKRGPGVRLDGRVPITIRTWFPPWVMRVIETEADYLNITRTELINHLMYDGLVRREKDKRERFEATKEKCNANGYKF